MFIVSHIIIRCIAKPHYSNILSIRCKILIRYPPNSDIICFPNVGIRLSLTEARLTNEGADLELTLRLYGYEGEANGAVTVDLSIADSLDGTF